MPPSTILRYLPMQSRPRRIFFHRCACRIRTLLSVKTWKVTLEYDGSKYRGWQEQRNARTIMGELRQVAERVFGGEVEIQGSGRTDAGVHASAQVWAPIFERLRTAD